MILIRNPVSLHLLLKRIPNPFPLARGEVNALQKTFFAASLREYFVNGSVIEAIPPPPLP